MSTEGGYILIKEASKKYGKTRQTFYNYMRKGLIQTKKSGNKVYMSVKDIERIFGSYLAPAQQAVTTEFEPQQTSQSIIDATYTQEIRVEALEQQLDGIQKTIRHLEDNQLKHNKHATPQYTSGQLAQDNELLISKLQAQAHNLQDYIQNIAQKLFLHTKKQRFARGYTCFLILNGVLIALLA